MRVLGLDPSLTNYGWALHNTEAIGLERCEERGRFTTKPKDFPDEISRYTYLRAQLSTLIERLQPEAMGIEHPVFGADYSEGMYGLFLFSLETIKAHKQDIVFFAPPQVKKFAHEVLHRPPKWIMHKSDMVEAAIEDTKSPILKGRKGRWDHNEADAYYVARASGRFWKLQRGILDVKDLTPYETAAFTLIRQITRGKRAGQVEIKGILHKESKRFFLWSKG